MAFVGPHASPGTRVALERVIASLAFPRERPGTTVDQQTELEPAVDYPAGSLTLVRAPGEICDGSVNRCGYGSASFYLVHAPGVLQQPELIQPCTPTASACTPPGAFYAIGWQSIFQAGSYRSACDLQLDRFDDEFYCTNSTARWDRLGRVIQRPTGARIDDPLDFAFAKIAWDGDVVLITSFDRQPPSSQAARLLWPNWNEAPRPSTPHRGPRADAYEADR